MQPVLQLLKIEDRFYGVAKGLLMLFVYHDPLVNKIILNFTDACIEEQTKGQASGLLTGAEIQMEWEAENLRGLVDEINKFRAR